MKIAVFCSSSDDIPTSYHHIAVALGLKIAHGGHSLIYGGTPCGLMGSVASSVASVGAMVIGVIPKQWQHTNLQNHLNSETIFVANLAERKQWMALNADLFVVLPGGIGTFDEAFSLMAMHQIGETSKKVYFVNANNFFNGLQQQLQQCTTEHCMTMNGSSSYAFVDQVNDLPI